jgi:molecular chaperone GrpE (heat shock protein)
MPALNRVHLAKWPFLVGDGLLLAVAGWLVLRPGVSWDLWQTGWLVVCVGVGAWLAVLPFIMEFRASAHFAEADRLASTVERIKSFGALGDQVAAATARWQSVQEAADKTAKAAQEITDRLTAEARGFAESMARAHDAEVRNLRLEVEKWQRTEAEWLQTLVRLLDQVFALHLAAVRSNQPGLIEQLTRFQGACRDIARRVGVMVLEVAPGAPYDSKQHQLPEGVTAGEQATVSQMAAPGYSYQGQIIRQPMVLLQAPEDLTLQQEP